MCCRGAGRSEVSGVSVVEEICGGGVVGRKAGGGFIAIHSRFGALTFEIRCGRSREKRAARPPHSKGEHKAKNNVCFLFAMVLICSSRFSTGASCVGFGQCYKMSGTCETRKELIEARTGGGTCCGCGN